MTWQPREQGNLGDTTQARLFYPDGRIDHFRSQTIAYAIWLALSQGTRAAFRGAGDLVPVYSQDFADRR